MTIPNTRPWHMVNGHEFLKETKHEVMVVVLNGFNLIFVPPKTMENCWKNRRLIGSPKGVFQLNTYNTRWWFRIFFNFHPYQGKCSKLTNIFQMGWFNHQPENTVGYRGLTYHPATLSFIQTFQYQFHPLMSWDRKKNTQKKPKSQVGPFPVLSNGVK